MANTNRGANDVARRMERATYRPREASPPQPRIAQGKNGFVPQNTAPATKKVPVSSPEAG